MEGVGNPSVGLEISSVSDRGMKVTGSPAYPAIEASGKWGIAAYGTTTGLYANSNNIAPAADAVADAVWDETIAGSTNTSKAAGQLNAAGAGGDPSAIAAAVWDEEISGHLTTSTPTKFGGFFASMFDSAGARIKMYLRQLHVRAGDKEHALDIEGGLASDNLAAGSGIKIRGGGKNAGSMGGHGIDTESTGSSDGLRAGSADVGGNGISAEGPTGGAGNGISATPGAGGGYAISGSTNDLLDGPVAELTSTPAATASLKTKLQFLFMKFKNKNNLTKTGVASGTENVCKDDGTPISKRLFTDNGSVSEWSKMENP
jgi:hypothetical protein